MRKDKENEDMISLLNSLSDFSISISMLLISLIKWAPDKAIIEYNFLLHCFGGNNMDQSLKHRAALKHLSPQRRNKLETNAEIHLQPHRIG